VCVCVCVGAERVTGPIRNINIELSNTRLVHEHAISRRIAKDSKSNERKERAKREGKCRNQMLTPHPSLSECLPQSCKIDGWPVDCFNITKVQIMTQVGWFGSFRAVAGLVVQKYKY